MPLGRAIAEHVDVGVVSVRIGDTTLHYGIDNCCVAHHDGPAQVADIEMQLDLETVIDIAAGQRNLPWPPAPPESEAHCGCLGVYGEALLIGRAAAESNVEPVPHRPARLLARRGEGTGCAIVVDDELRVLWADLGALARSCPKQARFSLGPYRQRVHRSSRRVSYRKFSQAVRRFNARRLLDKVSAVSASLARADAGLDPERWNPDGSVQQFSLAAVARTAIIEDGRRKTRTPNRPVTDTELHELCGLSIEVDHPDIPEHGAVGDQDLARLMARIIYQQALFKYSDFENIARTIGLLVEHDSGIRGLPTPSDWGNALGVPLTKYMTIVFQLASVATTYGGGVTIGNLHECHRLGFFAGTDVETVIRVIQDHLAADLGTLREEGRNAEKRTETQRMWSSNPLMGRPLVDQGDRGFVLPVYNFLIQKITPLGLFFTGLQHFGSDFPRALGDSFEAYVGRQLAQLEAAGATIYSEITYGHENKQSIDYFVVFNEVILLVEVKSFRATEAARAGIDSGLEQLVSKVQAARDQIDRTAELLVAGMAEFQHLPANRPLRGLVITLEPIHHIDTFLYQDMFTSNQVESSTISAHDLERICPILAKQPDAGRRILDALTHAAPTPPSLSRSVKDLPAERNPVSDELWKSWDKIVPRPALTPLAHYVVDK